MIAVLRGSWMKGKDNFLFYFAAKSKIIAK
jgi:hypothetical protein